MLTIIIFICCLKVWLKLISFAVFLFFLFFFLDESLSGAQGL